MKFHSKISEVDGQPICFSREHEQEWKRVLLRALKLKSKILIELNSIDFSDSPNFKSARLTKLGKLVILTIFEEVGEKLRINERWKSMLKLLLNTFNSQIKILG